MYLRIALKPEKPTAPTYHYCVIKEMLPLCGMGICNTYGIELRGGGVFDRVHDVSGNLDEVLRAAERFNKYQLAPVHFHDAVEDMLAEMAIFKILP